MEKELYYFNFIYEYFFCTSLSSVHNLESMLRDLENLAKDNPIEKKSFQRFKKAMLQCRREVFDLNRTQNYISSYDRLGSLYKEREECKFQCFSLNQKIEKLILQYFLKKGNERILKETLFQSNLWKYPICYSLLEGNYENEFNHFFQSLTEEEQIDVYIALALASDNTIYNGHISSRCEHFFRWMFNNNSKFIVSLLSKNFKPINRMNINYEKYRDLTLKFFEAEYYIARDRDPLQDNMSIVESQLFLFSQANENEIKSIINSLSDFEIVNILYSDELQEISTEIQSTVTTYLQERYHNMSTHQKEKVFLRYFDICFWDYIRILRKVTLEERLEIMNPLNSKQLAKINNEIGIKEFRSFLF